MIEAVLLTGCLYPWLRNSHFSEHVIRVDRSPLACAIPPVPLGRHRMWLLSSRSSASQLAAATSGRGAPVFSSEVHVASTELLHRNILAPLCRPHGKAYLELLRERRADGPLAHARVLCISSLLILFPLSCKLSSHSSAPQAAEHRCIRGLPFVFVSGEPSSASRST